MTELISEIVKWGVAPVVVLYILFVIIMRYKQKRDEEGGLEWYEWIFVGALLIVGYPLDVLVNLFVGTAVFLDVPKELTLSGRIDRYVNGEDGWRKSLAEKIAPLLNKHDPGHIR